jgi:hypothetical protein
MVLICSVPATVDGCLLVTPSLLRFISPLDWLSPFQIFDIGVKIASIHGLGGKLRFAFRTYRAYVDTLQGMDPPYAVRILIPDDWEVNSHIKLARAWLGSEERRLLLDGLRDLGVVDIQEILVIRRVLAGPGRDGVDLSPFREFLGRGLLYGIPLHVSNAMVDGSNIRCSAYPDACIHHAASIIDALSEVDEKAEFHLMGPPIVSVLNRLDHPRIVSADTTSHRVDIKHMRIEGMEVLISLAKYLK